jgi:hypothetical protein
VLDFELAVRRTLPEGRHIVNLTLADIMNCDSSDNVNSR